MARSNQTVSSGASRSAWEGANFWQRMNPVGMTHVPMPAGRADPLDILDLEAREFTTARGADKAKRRGLTMAEIRHLKDWRWRRGRRVVEQDPF